eukprot:TRINITY_DN3838_c0_g1_i1.p1 TRINITY_DN3838_c0_g1~~TRINITY_DN3838_c0_g1_i1.p1  ORF type:complete len:268 (+),score=67.68 TRINITY_DN3838_c0_g1_i1:48-806(+)
MSSLRNAVKRKTHKERSQPADRKKYGLLEKHKDYVLRARDFHRKEKAIKTLREKAVNRNPDEFYFGMQNAQTRDGIHRTSITKPNKYTQEELLLMKTQDMAYILAKAQAEKKKVERLQASLHATAQAAINRHIVFEDDEDEERETAVQVEDESRDTGGDELTPEVLTLERLAGAKSLPKRAQKLRAGAYRELQQRRERAQKMMSLVVDMDLKKQVMGRGSKRKIKLRGRRNKEDEDDGAAPVVFRWRRERKK